MHRRSPSDSEVITSSTNPVIKRIRSLQRRKFRDQERAFVVEGVRAVQDVLAAGVLPETIILRDDTTFELPQMGSAPIRRVRADVFDSLTDLAHPQGVLAVIPRLPESELPDPAANPFVVVLDGIRDPGNMGTLFRSAAGAGVDHLIIGPESVDPYHPKAVRAAMGSHFKIRFSNRQFAEIEAYMQDFPLVALAHAGGNALYDSVNWHRASALIVGSEAFGPSAALQRVSTANVSIPLANEVESLNAGVAGSIIMFEAARQRRGIPAE